MLKSGQTVADYQIVKPLSENQLFATYQVSGETWPTAKLLLFSAAQLAEKKSADDFINQAKLLAGQSFPGLQSLLTAGFDGDYGFCLYPLPAGVPLADKLLEERPVQEVLALVRSVAVSLTAAHESGLWHGAISPANIYLDGSVVSLDQFALASLLQLDFHSGIDPRYTSPELVRGEEPETATDLYSLGIVLYRLLLGEVPFSGDDAFATAMLHVQEQVQPLPDQFALLQPLLDGLLAAMPAERINAEQLVSEVDRLLEVAELADLTTAAREVYPELPGKDADESPSRVEKFMGQSDMATRIEQRLNERSDILQQSAEIVADAKRANTDRISAIGQQNHRETSKMNHNPYQQQRRPSRFLVLIALGIAVGVIIYAVLFVAPKKSGVIGADLPEALKAGLQEGSQLLVDGDLQAAEKAFVQLTDSFAAYPQPYNNLAAISAQQGDLERSRELLERAMATDTAYATVYRNLGTVYAEMARDSYGRALQLDQGQRAIALQLFGSNQVVRVADTGSSDGQQIASTAEMKQEQEEIAVDEKVAAGVETSTEGAVSASETVSAEKVAEVVMPASEVSAEAAQPESVDIFLSRWADAWSAQDVDAYLEFYAKKFRPSSGDSREKWAQLRRSRLTRPKSIEVVLSGFSEPEQTDGQVEVEVTQSYKSDRYVDKTRKRFSLVLVDNEWQIVRERSLGRAR